MDFRRRLRSAVAAAGDCEEARRAAFAAYDASAVAGPGAPARRIVALDASDDVVCDERRMTIATSALRWFADPERGEERSALFTHATVGGVEGAPPGVLAAMARMACPSKRKTETFVSVLCADPPPGLERLLRIHASHAAREAVHGKGNFETFCRMSGTTFVRLRNWSGELQVVAVSLLNFVMWALDNGVYEEMLACQDQLDRVHAATSAATKKRARSGAQKNHASQKRPTRNGDVPSRAKDVGLDVR